ncbi:ABC transporter substrate-binding protein [Sediminicoccus rosea]|jgi:branched-chain amino acid transport system substrate-binding protein|uniref:ABC transporter substrate-binding protein n=1 Tax=Sediminicoccus rosea TaxID=1225128 RepID=A0ABZ0PE05_9PROT|nr:ABC transporter substrate-binding protein [Sediminicoccus rosea]WPB83837.1 ABC transporter substrate-binding protein [Sediminicoccus rosea]
MIRRRPLMLAGLAVPAIATAQAGPLPLGFTTAKSGNWVSLTRRNEIAVNLAVEEVNASGGIHGRPIAIRTFDTASRPEQAAIATRQFAEDDGALAVIGPFSSSECRVAFPVGDRLGIAQMAIASSAPGLAAPFRFAFRNTSDEAYLFERLLSVVREKGIETRNAAIAYTTDEVIGRSMGTSVFPNLLQAAGIPVTGTVSFPVAAFDMSAQVAQMRGAAPDLVCMGGPPEPAIVLVREMRRQGMRGRIVGGTTIVDVNLPARMGADGNGTLVSSTHFYNFDSPRAIAFRDEFVRRAQAAGETGDLRPGMYDAAAHSIVHFYAAAMRQVRVTGERARLAAERAAIRDALRAMRNVETIEGTLARFTEQGDALKTTYVLEVRDGNFVLVGSRPPPGNA